MLFTFPSRYCFTIGHQGVFSLGRWSCQIHDGVSRAPRVLGIRLGESKFSATGLLPSMAGLSRPLHLTCSFVTPCETSHNPRRASPLVWALPRSLAATDGITCCFLFLRVLRCFSSPGMPPPSAMDSLTGYRTITVRGFPHSEIPGSMPAYGSPRHIAVRHVLLRLLAPRHPPCALSA